MSWLRGAVWWLGWVAAWASAQGLPAPVQQALRAAEVPLDAVSVVVADSRRGGPVWASHRAEVPVNPASAMKLVTTFAALDRLGPAHVWQTRVYTDGPVVDGVLRGNLYLQGGGDPQLVAEKLWLLLRRVQGLGIQRIAGDVVLDRSGFDLPAVDPGAFDGEPLRPYNATPDALLVNFKSQVWTFVPDEAAGVARIAMEPPLADVEVPATVPLASGPCGDWRTRLQADWTDAAQPRFRGGYPSACGERSWPLAYPAPERFAERAVAGMWRSLSGQVTGRVREGVVPPTAERRLEQASPALAEVVRVVNKFSNNVMAQHVFLALAEPSDGAPADFGAAQAALQRWWVERIGRDVPPPKVVNGAGLSRDARISAVALAQLLQVAWASSVMPELVSSLPASGADGTLRRSPMGLGLAHLKTGSLRDVQALAGYVHGPEGQRRVLVAIVNHPNARAARPALDALVHWAAER